MSLTKKEERILKSIRVASENDPTKPEFPPKNPKFPATPTYKIHVPGFTNVWLKDESVNPTGTHKDRMAWEIVVTYRQFLLAKKSGLHNEPLPSMSIISSGNAALAIQAMLSMYGLPPLKVLVDIDLPDKERVILQKACCRIYSTDLSRNMLMWRDILRHTKNGKGFDITSSVALDPSTRFYDWLGYEVINQSPEYCFIPFGTGQLYENILNINKKEVQATKHDPRFSGNVRTLQRCHFLGATSNNPRTKADKLYAPYLPFANYDEQWIRLYKNAGFCGKHSTVLSVQEKFFDEAMKIAQSQNINCEYSIV